MDASFMYALFIKIHRSELQQLAANYIEKHVQHSEEKAALHILTTSFIQFLATQHHLQLDSLHYWTQVHRQSVVKHRDVFVNALSYSLDEMLRITDHSAKADIQSLHEQLIVNKMLFQQPFSTMPLQYSAQLQQQLDHFTLELVKHNGSEDLVILLKHLEQIFRFKRCMFFSYNPWLDEFSGVIGAEAEKIERIRGKISIEPVFAMKQPLFLKTPAPYVQQIAIDLFELSSVIFIPVTFNEQLYGWLTFDQCGQAFDCDDAELSGYTEVGRRLGFYLGRKQLRHTLNRQISLSEKELMILYLLVEGYSNKEIASFMYMSEFTVRDYVKALMQKLNARNRTHLIALAFRSGIVD